MSLQGVIFDLDGTLGDTLPVCFTAVRETFRRYLGQEYGGREIRAMFGPTEEGILQDVLPDCWEEGLRHYLASADSQAAAFQQDGHHGRPRDSRALRPAIAAFRGGFAITRRFAATVSVGRGRLQNRTQAKGGERDQAQRNRQAQQLFRGMS